jgi:hypothetical protein
MKEEWEDIPDFPDHLVSNFGQIYNMRTKNILILSGNQQGVTRVALLRDGKQYQRSVSLLVATAFIPRPYSHFNTAINLDGVRTNCRVDNLAWRPRWFSARFHRQFARNDVKNSHRPILDETTGEVFENMKAVCVRYGVLSIDIMNAMQTGYEVFPIGHNFRYVTPISINS